MNVRLASHWSCFCTVCFAILTLALPAPPASAGPDGKWRQITTAHSPGARSSAVAVYDRHGRRMLLFGGQVGSAIKNDVWELSLGCTPDWRQITTSNPPSKRNETAGIYDPVRKQFVIYGGRDSSSQLSSETWALSLTDSTWTKLDERTGSACQSGGSKPCPRTAHSAVYNDSLDRMWMFGGLTCVSMQDHWSERLTTGTNPWTKICGKNYCDNYDAYEENPLIRTNHVEIFDARNKKAVVFGGDYDGEGGSSVAWISLASGCSWVSVQSTPPQPGRAGHTAVYDSVRARMLVFGGGLSATDSTIALSLPVGGGTPTWSTLHPQGTPPPSTTADHVAIFDPVEDRMIVLDNNGNTYELQFDSVAPATTEDLIIAGFNVGAGTVKLMWTAPGEDGAGGCRATSYSVRLRTDAEITESNWATATVVSGVPAPAIPGAMDSLTVSGLTAPATFQFALKTTDYAGNSSGLSNNACIQWFDGEVYLCSGFPGFPTRNDHSTKRARDEGAPARELAITAVRPNPTSEGGAEVSFALASSSAATLEVLDVAGRRVEAHDLARLGQGNHTLRIGARASLAPGHYWVRIRQDGRSVTRSATVIR